MRKKSIQIDCKQIILKRSLFFQQVIRIRSNNPGKWFLHCHIEVHALDGMGMVINEAPEHPLTPPKGFPTCVNFYDDHSRDIGYVESNLQGRFHLILHVPMINIY